MGSERVDLPKNWTSRGDRDDNGPVDFVEDGKRGGGVGGAGPRDRPYSVVSECTKRWKGVMSLL